MSSTDDRIVKMQFDNAQFKRGAAETKTSLDNVNKAVDSAGKSKGLLDLSSNMGRVQVSASKMAIVTTTALATIANKVVNVGINMAKSLTLDPIKQGFHEYEALLTKQNTIMNATGKSAGQVKRVLNDLNTYSDKTIYSFADMTEGITSFVNAGVPLKQASAAMKGIANASALAGASTQEAQSSFRAFGQALGQGFLGLQDFRQAAVTGKIGTVGFKQSLIDAGVAAGTLTKRGKEYVTANGKVLTATKGFDLSLQTQWASAKVLNTALGTYADTQSRLGKKAYEAAEKVRTFSAFMDTLKESLGSGWAQIFSSMIGGLNQSTKLWTGLANAVGSKVQMFFNFAAATLTTWRSMGGLQKTLQGFKNILAPTGALFSAIGTAWRQAFPTSGPKGAGSALYSISAGFEAVTRPLQLVADLITGLTPVFKVFFQILGIGKTILSNIVGDIISVAQGLGGFGKIEAPSGGFLDWLKKLGKAIASAVDDISDLLAKGKSLKDAFSSVDIKLPGLPKMPKLPSFGGGGGLKAPTVDTGPLDKVSSMFAKAKTSLQDSARDAQSAGEVLGNVLSKVGDAIKKFVSGISMEDVVSSLNLAVLATFLTSASRMFNTLTKSFQGFVGVGAGIKDTLDGAQGALKAYADQQKAKKIMYYAIAIGLLAASLWLLSKIPIKDMVPALAAMGVIFFMLNKAMKGFADVLKETDGVTKSVNMVALGISIVLLAGAMLLFATAMLVMNRVEWQSVAKGLITMAAGLKMMEAVAKTGEGAWKNLLGAAVAFGAVAVSMVILAGALMLFQLVKWESIGKAGVVLAGLTLAIGALALIPYQGIAKVGAALLMASVGMLAMANALIIFALVRWESIGKAAVMLGLLTISLAVLMAVGGPASAAAMLGLAGAMVLLAGACLMLNKVDWESIGKAALVLTVLLAALAVGAAIMTVFLYAIAPVAPVLIILAAGFFLLGLGLLAFSAAMALAITLGAAGVTAFAALATGAAVAVGVFMQTLASEAPLLKHSFLQILQNLIDTIVEAVPMIIQGIKDLWKAVKKEFQGDDKKKSMGDTAKAWIEKLADGIKAKIPVIVQKAKEIAIKLINGLIEHAGAIAAAGGRLIISLINGLGSQMAGIAAAAGRLIIHFIQAIGTQAAKIADAAQKAVITFIHALADSIRENGPEMGDAMSDLGIAMVQGLIGGIGAMFGNAMSAIGGLAQGMINKAKGILKIFSPSRVFHQIGKFLVDGLTNGIQTNAAAAINATASMVSGQIAIANEYISGFIQKLDQQALAARGKADGIAAAAEVAARAADRQAKLADKTKTKKDDQKATRAQNAAKAMGTAAEKAAKVADAKEKAAEAAKARQDRAEQFKQADYFDKAKMRSEDAQTQLDSAKAYEQRAAKERQEAASLVKAAAGKNVSAKERKAMLAQAADLRKQALADAKKFDTLVNASRASAADALRYQTSAGKEAADAFQKQFEEAAKADAEAAAYEKLTDAEKAAKRRQDAATLAAQADKDLAAAKRLAYSDLEGANALAAQAMTEADQARQYLDDAVKLDESVAAAAKAAADEAAKSADTPTTPTSTPGTLVDLQPTEAAALAFNAYADLYDSAYAAAAAGPTVEFNQYNTSPESLNPTEVYRQTNNLVTYAADKLAPSAP